MTDSSFQTLLDNETDTALPKFHVPSIAALIQIDGKVVAQSAAGVRRIGESTPIEHSDLWHLGSCTNAMTATMAGSEGSSLALACFHFVTGDIDQAVALAGRAFDEGYPMTTNMFIRPFEPYLRKSPG